MYVLTSAAVGKLKAIAQTAPSSMHVGLPCRNAIIVQVVRPHLIEVNGTSRVSSFLRRLDRVETIDMNIVMTYLWLIQLL
jgi:hypothetical protein